MHETIFKKPSSFWRALFTVNLTILGGAVTIFKGYEILFYKIDYMWEFIGGIAVLFISGWMWVANNSYQNMANRVMELEQRLASFNKPFNSSSPILLQLLVSSFFTNTLHESTFGSVSGEKRLYFIERDNSKVVGRHKATFVQQRLFLKELEAKLAKSEPINDDVIREAAKGVGIIE